MPVKPYSFRYPYDIQTTWDALRKKFTGPTGEDPQYSVMLNRMDDRDRELEDYLSLGVSQGRLGYVITTASQGIPVGTEAALTGLTVTITIPSNRVIRITGQALFNCDQNTTLIGWVNEDGVNVAAFGENANGNTGGVIEHLQCGSAIRTPAAGTHVYTLRGQAIGAGPATVGASAAAPGFILVEDIGPSSR